VPENVVLGFKVPEDITVETWPKHARYGQRAGLVNEHFLNTKALDQFFKSRLKRYGKQVGRLIFEFGTFNKKTFPTPADFLAALDPFLTALPEEFEYAVEIRNLEYLWRSISMCWRAKTLPTSSMPGRECRRSISRLNCMVPGLGAQGGHPARRKSQVARASCSR
jgi:hypothetical protein